MQLVDVYELDKSCKIVKIWEIFGRRGRVVSSRLKSTPVCKSSWVDFVHLNYWSLWPQLSLCQVDSEIDFRNFLLFPSLSFFHKYIFFDNVLWFLVFCVSFVFPVRTETKLYHGAVADLDIYNGRGHEIEVPKAPILDDQDVDGWRMRRGIPLPSQLGGLASDVSFLSGVRAPKTIFIGSEDQKRI